MELKPRDLILEIRIDDYFQDKLNEDQIIDLWADLFNRPDYLGLLETELLLRTLISPQIQQNRHYTNINLEEKLNAVRNTGS